jgi:beta-lactamase regulating signal transducer with metallopeptidase domain
MKFEHSFALVFLSALVSVVAVFSSLFEKYTSQTAVHFVQSCTQTLSSFLSSPYHWTGISIFSLVFILSLYFGVKLLLSTFKTHLKMKRFTRLKVARVPRNIATMCRRRAIKPTDILIVKNAQPVAFAMGIFSQKIVVTSGLIKLLSSAELEAVLLHEHYHVRHRHTLLLLGAELISSTLSFLPSLFDVLNNMRAYLEQAADAYAVRTQATERHLLSAIRQVMAYDHPQHFSPGFAVSLVDQRISKLTHHHSIPCQVSKWRLAATLMSVSIFSLLLAAPPQTQATYTEPAQLSVENCGDGLLCSIRCLTLEPIPTYSTESPPLHSSDPNLRPALSVESNQSSR